MPSINPELAGCCACGAGGGELRQEAQTINKTIRLICFIIAPMVVTFLALGSNLGDRKGYLKNAIEALKQHRIQVVRIASIYETEPKGLETQPWFLNTVALCHTDYDPSRLLEVCFAIERENARIRDRSNGPRTLDIDIIFYAEHVIDEPELTIPHPRFSERRFVLVPLAELAPDFVDPVSGKTVATLLAECADRAAVRRLSAFDDAT
jgi:2-amino-4-hydroxy-6-hydroxymethyldihydropteridine diphosphokinase